MKMSHRSTPSVSLIIGLCLVHIAAHAAVITCDTMVSDGSTDNSKALAAAMKAAQSEPEKTVIIPAAARAYTVKSILTVPEGVSLVGQEGAKLNASLRLSDHSVVDNIDFTDGARRVIIGETSLVTGAKVKNCSFGTSEWTPLLAYRANDCLVSGNTFSNKKRGGNIIILGGKRNIIRHNSVSGGRTAILFLYSRTSNGGGYESLIEDNIVEFNTVHDVPRHQYEEGISFDTCGDGPTATAALEYDKVSSANGKQVVLSHANWAPTGNPSYVGYDMVFLSGDLAGRTRRITAQSSATFTLDKSVSGAAKGDEIVIGATFKRNIVRNNIVSSPDLDDAILLYGMAFQNTIESNTVAKGACITVLSYDNAVRAKDSVTGTWGRVPCGHNVVRGNTVGGLIKILYYGIPEIKGHKNTYAKYYSYGNSVIGNKVSGRICARWQYLNLSGNTGTKDFRHVHELRH